MSDGEIIILFADRVAPESTDTLTVFPLHFFQRHLSGVNMNIQEFKLLGDRARHDYISSNFPASNKSISKRKLSFGVGVNDCRHIAQAQISGIFVQDPCYSSWGHMLARCYSARVHAERETYADCSISSDWMMFSAFRDWWLEHQVDGWNIDKDILFFGNKIYSKHTCVFVPQAINKFILDRGSLRGEFMIGCGWNKAAGKFRSKCNNPITGKQEHLGYFTLELDAHLAWKRRKIEFATLLCEQFPSLDPRILPALLDRYS